MSVVHDDTWFRDFRRKLTRWFASHQRQLPWRGTKDPYAIWVSEIMLQQTQVATVVDYYKRFLDRFPDIRSLATADEEVVLAHWSGLGYYRRARGLHAAAKLIVSRHAGVFPKSFEDVLELPGVGRYTAGAITSIAFDCRNPILEANTVRLFARLIALKDDPLSSASQGKLWRFATEILPARKGSGQVNQAAMELGSLVCTPVAPSCSTCPVLALCPTNRLGLQTRIPLAKVKVRITEETHALAIVTSRDGHLMRRNEADQWWSGLWDFPRLRVSHLDLPKQGFQNVQPGKPQTLNPELRELVEAEFHSGLGLACKLDDVLLELTHGVTRFRIRVLCFRVVVPGRLRLSRLPGSWKWMRFSSPPELPLTSPANKILNKLYERNLLGNSRKGSNISRHA